MSAERHPSGEAHAAFLRGLALSRAIERCQREELEMHYRRVDAAVHEERVHRGRKKMPPVPRAEPLEPEAAP